MGYSRVRSKHEQGQLVFYDSQYRQRWIDAYGPNVVKFIDDFAACLYDTSWESTVVEAGSGSSLLLPYNSEGGIVKFAAAGNDNDGIQIQSANEGFKLTANDPLYFGARWAVTGTTGFASADTVIGLCNKDTSLTGGSSSGVFFMSVDAAATITFTASKADSATSHTIVTTGAVDTWYVDEFFWDGSSTIYCWHNGVAQTSHVTQIASAQSLAVSISFLNGAAHGENVAGMLVDWVRVIQLLASR